MTRSRLYLTVFYALVATAALTGTWFEGVIYLIQAQEHGGLAGAAATVLADARGNPAARMMSLDLLLVCLAATTFMVLEARRLGIRFVWIYVAAAFLVAVAVAVPLFLIARERHLAWHEGDEDGWIPVGDGLGIAALSITVVALSGCVFAA